MKEQLEFFKENGYLVVPDALSPEEVCSINAAIDRDLVENPVMWQDRGQMGRRQNVHALLACPGNGCDHAATHTAAVDGCDHGEKPSVPRNIP